MHTNIYNAPLEERERHFAQKVNNKYKGVFSYHSGFAGVENSFDLLCLRCGHIQRKSAKCIRNKNVPRCDNCYRELINDRKKLRTMLKEQQRSLDDLTKRVAKKEGAQKDTHYKRCRCCDHVFVSDKENKIYCSSKCFKKQNHRTKELNRRNKVKTNGKIDIDISLEKLIRKDENKCYICDSACDQNDYTLTSDGHYVCGMNYPSIDHVVPINKGGTHTWDNIRLAHHYCNALKSDNEAVKS